MPFKIPVIFVISSAVNDWFNGLMIGIPPPTLASNKKFLSGPCLATSSLLDVQTLLPFSSAALTNVYAGSTPPITSAITSISGSLRITL